jgi:glycosyltransferase involved in cell wall biosynthesis
MHVVHFCAALKGGPLSAIAPLIHRQVSAGWQVTLIYSPARDPVETFRSELPGGIELIPLDVYREIHPASDFAAGRKLTKWLKHRKPSIIHLHSSKAGAVGRIAARLAGVPTIYSPHAIAFLRRDVSVATRVMFYVLEWLLGLAGATTVACSSSELAAMRLLPGHKMMIPNGVDLAGLPSLSAQPNRTYLNVILCGRITAQKNPKLACAIAEASSPHWRWTWLGGGDLEDLVKIRGRIAVTGWLSRGEVLAKLAAADVVVHTSSWEGMPIALLEAMGIGLPAVVTDVPGNRDVVDPTKTGFICRTLDDFVYALNILANEPALRRKMGDAARARVQRMFDLDRLQQRWISLYKELVRH